MPGWLKTLSHLTPLTYVVDAIRTFMLAGSTSTFGSSYDDAVTLLTSTILVFIGVACIPVLHHKMFALVPFLGFSSCLEHLIVLRFFDSFFYKLRTLAPPFAILVFAKRLWRVMPD